jgi:PAS domain S-box-containing protein
MSMVAETKDTTIRSPRPSRARGVLRLVLAYVFVSILWIVVSNALIGAADLASGDHATWHIVRDLLFVALTSVLLFLLVKRLVTDISRTDEQFFNVAEQARDIIVLCDPNLHIVYANPAFLEITGYTAGELEGRHVVTILPAESAARLTANVEALRSKPCLRGRWIVIGKAGQQCHLEVTCQLLTDGRYLAIGTVIDEVLVAQKSAEQERQRLNVLLRSLPDPVWLKDAGGVFIACNPAMEKFANRPAEQIIGHTTGDLFASPTAEEFTATNRIVTDTKQQFTYCQSFPCPDGSISHFVITKCPVLDADGRLTAIFGIARDITAEQKAHFELAASEKRFHTLFDSATDMILVADMEARFTAVNRRACEVLGYTRDELMRMCVMDIQLAYTFEELSRFWQSKEFEHGISARGLHRRKDGSTIQVESRINRLDIDGQKHSMAIVRDISAQIAAENQIRASNEVNRAILDATTAQMAVIDQRGDLIAVNAAWTRFAEEHSCDAHQEPRTGLGSNFFNVCCQDCQPDTDQAQVAAAGVRAVLNGETESFSMESKCATPEGMLWFLMNASPLKAGAGGAVITYLDITGIKEAQETQLRYSQQLQALARKHQEIEEKERLRLSMELHDQIGQSLAALKMSLAQAKRGMSESPASTAALAQAMNIVDSVAKSTHDISHRLRPPLLDELGIKSALSWHIGNLPCPENVRIRFDDEIGAERFPESVELACFRIIQEALNNALRHAEPTEIKVKIYSTPDHLCLAVEDDGRGFDLDIPLQPNEQWISLGLIGIRERIAQLGGSLQIDSKPNAGTQVSACLPKEIPA